MAAPFLLTLYEIKMTRGGIGRLLRKTFKGSSEEKPLSISEKINSACVHGVTATSAFSVL